MTTVISKSLPGIETGEEKQIRAQNTRAEQKSTSASAIDSFVSSGNEKVDPEKDGKFTFKQAGKNFLLGLISPLKALISNPILTACMIALPIGLSFFAGAAAVMQFVGIGLFFFGGVTAVCEFGRGGYKFISSAIKGDKDGMENAFKDAGAGVSGIVMTLLGAKGTFKTMKGLFTKKSEVADLICKDLADMIEANSSKIADSPKPIGILPDNDVTELLNTGVPIDREWIGKLTQGELIELQEQIKLARKVSDDEILGTINRIYEQKKREMARRLGVDEAKLSKALGEVKIDETLNTPAAVNPFDEIRYAINPKKIRFVSIAEELIRKLSGRDGVPDIEISTSSFCGGVQGAIYKVAHHEPVHVEQFVLYTKCLHPIRYVANLTRKSVKHCTSLEWNKGVKGFIGKILKGIKGVFIGIVGGTLVYIKTSGKLKGIQIPHTVENMKRVQLISKAFDNYSPQNVLVQGIYENSFLEIEANINGMLGRLQGLSRELQSQEIGRKSATQFFSNLERELSHETMSFRNPPTARLQKQYSQIENLMKEITTTLGLTPKPITASPTPPHL